MGLCHGVKILELYFIDLRTAQAHFVPAFSTWLDVANMRLIKRIEKSFEVDQCLPSQVGTHLHISLTMFVPDNLVMINTNIKLTMTEIINPVGQLH